MWIDKFVRINEFTRPGTKLKAVKKIVMHYTANPGASSFNHFKYFDGTCITQKRYASAHIFVDKLEAYCIVPLDEVAYHCNDGSYRGVEALKPNGNLLSIGIELCIDKDGSFHPETLRRAEEITAELCKRYKLDPINDIVRHYDVTKKNCPAAWVSKPQDFIDFKTRVKVRISNGWVKVGGKWYFYKEGHKVTGWLKDKNKWYFLDSIGVMQTGWIQDKNKWYLLSNDGSMRVGWVQDKGKWYYLSSSGAMQTGLIQDKGKYYLLGSDGAMRTKSIDIKPDGSLDI